MRVVRHLHVAHPGGLQVVRARDRRIPDRVLVVQAVHFVTEVVPRGGIAAVERTAKLLPELA